MWYNLFLCFFEGFFLAVNKIRNKNRQTNGKEKENERIKKKEKPQKINNLKKSERKENSK